MKLSLLLTLATTAFTAVSAQSAQALADAAYLIGNATNLINNDVTNINGTQQGLPWALQVQQDSVYTYRLVKNATAVANASPVFDENGSFLIAITLINLSTATKTSLSNLITKNTTIGGLQPAVLASLYALKSVSDVFANATIAKLSAAYQGVAPQVKGQLDDAFNQAIAAYGGKRKFA